ncbi:uncharacterized protein si:ch211-133n4.6 isoform X2 [Eleginops maclovinus]|uniref:uncharacterized protein si:ch211-133n4.6 isoform X2 n=1 Tax=Eleginops maclovinus TaxID=56733 RepID=UPI00308061E6
MLTRNVLLVSVFILMAEGDMDSNDVGIQTMLTDRDSSSDEVPTASINAVSLDPPAPAANHVTAPETAAAAANSVEDDEDGKRDSEEGEKKKFRSAKPQSPAPPPQIPAHVIISPAQPSPAHSLEPIMPQPKAAVRNRTSKRRSRTSRRQI